MINDLTGDSFESEIDTVIAELREQLTAEDLAEIDRWLNTEIDPETADAVDAEIEAFFDKSDAELLVDLKTRGAVAELAWPILPFGAEDPSPSLDDIYDALGIEEHEHVSICHKGTDGVWCAEIFTPADATEVIDGLTGDVYFGVNPVNVPVGTTGRRGAEGDVTRVVALWADLDVKDGACPDLDTANAIIDDLSAVLGTRPTVVIHSGHGAQPLWPVAHCGRLDGKVLLRRFGRLVEAVADRHKVAVDNVFDLPRVLRVPGTLNYKGEPVRTSASIAAGKPLTVAGVSDRLDGAGVYEGDDDRAVLSDVESDSDTWAFTGTWCRYAKAVTEAWGTDNPKGGRHHWAMKNLVRLATLWRHGCIPDEAAMHTVFETLHRRLGQLRAATGEGVKLYEIESGWIWAVERVSRMTDAAVSAEIKHSHDDEAEQDTDGDRQTPKQWPAPDDPRPVARQFLKTTIRAGPPWRYWNGLWLRYNGTHYQRLEEEALRDDLYDLLENAYYIGSEGTQAKWKPNPTKLKGVTDAARGLVKLPTATQASSWLDDRDELVIPCANGLLRVSDRKLLEHTPDYFGLFVLPYDYEPDATCRRWVQFLDEVFGDDTQSAELLQEWFIYVLTGRTDLHKMLLWIGPKRGGKGTVARVMKQLVSAPAYGGLKVTDLTSDFVLQNLIDKSLVVFPDERQVSSPEGKHLVQFILETTGEDDVHVNIKFRPPWNGRLPMRLMYMGNQMPVLPDTSGAVLTRLLAINTTATFAGREDRKLEGALGTELSGILNWALDGLDRLQKRGEFAQPKSGAALLADIDHYSNPIRQFLLDHCVLADGCEIRGKELWEAFDRSCRVNGIESHRNSAWFGRLLRPAMADLAPDVTFEHKQHDTEPGRPWYYHGIGLRKPASGPRIKTEADSPPERNHQ